VSESLTVTHWRERAQRAEAQLTRQKEDSFRVLVSQRIELEAEIPLTDAERRAVLHAIDRMLWLHARDPERDVLEAGRRKIAEPNTLRKFVNGR
jgi:hypothetical protein